jgi:DNA (cytosine-5)-methyltransferase 1
VENVAALLGRGLGRVLGDLAALGYDAEWHCIPASYVGAPHRRDRVWIVGYSDEVGRYDRIDIEQCSFEKRRLVFDGFGKAAYFNVSADDGKERAEGIKPQAVSGLGAFSWCKNVRSAEELRGRRDIPEPVFFGTRDGIPDWVDRVGAVGNAVVPQIAEMIGRAIMAGHLRA